MFWLEEENEEELGTYAKLWAPHSYLQLAEGQNKGPVYLPQIIPMYPTIRQPKREYKFVMFLFTSQETAKGHKNKEINI